MDTFRHILRRLFGITAFAIALLVSLSIGAVLFSSRIIEAIDDAYTTDITSALLGKRYVELQPILHGDMHCTFGPYDLTIGSIRAHLGNYSSNRWRSIKNGDWTVVSINQEIRSATLFRVREKSLNYGAIGVAPCGRNLALEIDTTKSPPIAIPSNFSVPNLGRR